MGKTKHRRLKKIAILLAAVFLVAIALVLLNVWEKDQDNYPSQIGNNTVIYQNKSYALKDDVESFLLIGIDKFEGSVSEDSYKNDQQADFLMLFVVDHNDKKVSAVHINRDTMVDVNILGLNGNKVDTVVRQIALSHTYGNGKEVSCNNTVNSVSSLLNNIKINHYLSMKMDAVAILNDLVGGVEVTVTHTLNETLVQGQTVLLRGEQALLYVRARQGLEDSSNIARMVRQKQYSAALYEKFLSCVENDENFSLDVITKLLEYIVSDRSATQLKQFANKLSGYELQEIFSIEGESRPGDEFVEFYADQNAIDKIIIDLFYEPKQ